MDGKVILSLFDLSGVWSRPYERAGYTVIRVDLQRGLDVRSFTHPGPVHGILLAPPCTHFTAASSRLWKQYDYNGRTNESLALVDAGLRFVALHAPVWWALENPPGRLKQWLGAPRYTFHPFHHGDPWKKMTCLWGRFTPPARSPVEPVWTLNGQSSISRIPPGPDRANKRAATPPGFAQAFFEANP